MAIEFSKYPRPGIFTEEIDSSVIQTPPVQEAIVNLVVGVSKKGRINAPVLISNPQERENVYGAIDRSLENKGSWFHRTIDVATQSGPIYGFNVYKTTSDDVLNYVSLSLSPLNVNGEVSTSMYDNFFNKSGFWVRDTEKTVRTADSATKLLHFVNTGDKKISVFVFKSSLPGFDVTAETWYGGRDKVPTYIYPTDLMSDYLVKVIAIAGDWSDYKTLANDIKYGKYFNASGLRKTQVDNFLLEKTVNVLVNLDGSVIPYFRDRNGRNIFIESLINQNTDRTNLFCAFDVDKFETDLPNGLVDLAGHTLVYSKDKPTNPVEKDTISFLSYSDTIIETDTYTNTVLDRLGNVAGIGTISPRTTAYANGNLSGLVMNASVINAATGASVTATVTSTSGYMIVGGAEVSVPTQSTPLATMTRSGASGNSHYRITTLFLDNDGGLNTIYSAIVDDTAGSTAASTVTGIEFPATYANSAIVLGYVFSVGPEDTNEDITHTYVPIALSGTAFVPLTIGTSGTDIIVETSSNDELNITFASTANVTKASYNPWRAKQLFDTIVAGKSSTETIIIDASGVKRSIAGAMWTDNSADVSSDKNISVIISGSTIRTQAAAGKLIIYFSDDEFIMGTQGLKTKTTAATSTEGVVAKYSSLYEDYYNGRINTGDYFYLKLADMTGVRFVSHTDGFDYIIFTASELPDEFESGFQLKVLGHTVNDGVYTFTSDALTSVSGITIAGSERAFKVSENVTTTDTGESIEAYSYGDKVYLKMYTVGSDLTVGFYADRTFTAVYTIPSGYVNINTDIKVYSGELSYEQTLEIEVPTGYTMQDNKVLVNANRYPEVVVGNFLKAFVDYDALEAGEIPKSFTRIISKKAWSGNTANNVNYVEITTDAKIDLEEYGTADYQTTRYTYINEYIDTYKTYVLGPFQMRTSALPDGTEARQSTILSVLATGTALFNAITNKNKFNWRYLVDSFGLGLTEFSKQELVDICGQRLNCIGFMNMPSIKSFKNSTSPSFVNADGDLVVSYIRQGGDPESNPAFLYSFAQGNGQSCAGYFTPWVTVNDNGRPINMPPAAYVMNTYMRKNNSRFAGVYPYTIAAGEEDGKILGIADLEHDYTPEDLNELNKMGANAIVYVLNKGFHIDNEWTAQREPLSSLSYLHSREVLIELENELFDMLGPYQWKFNTSGIRSEIKRKADNICDKYITRSALYAFLNVIDENNNTPEVIDNQFGLLETYVEIVKGMGVIINRVNVMSTGQLAGSTGFTATGQQTLSA